MAVRKTHAGIVKSLGNMVKQLEQHILDHGEEIEEQDAKIAKATEAKNVSNKEIKAATNTVEKLRDIIG